MKDCLESFIWKTFECEVWKTKYPYTLKNGEIYYNIFDIGIPDGPFCILESLSIDKNSSRMIFIMKPNKDQMEFKVGRGHDSDIRVSDISVSRFHAKIKYQDGKFLLEDNTSKFGTLVMIKDKTPIIKNHTCAVQSGRTVVTYMLKSMDNIRNAQQQQWKHSILYNNNQQNRKIDECKSEDLNNKNNSIQIDHSSMMENIGGMLARDNRQIPEVSENILRQDMEEERDNSQQNDEADE